MKQLRRIFWVFVLALPLESCHRPATPTNGPDRGYRVLAENLNDVRGLAVREPHVAFISHRLPDGTAGVTQFEKGEPTPFVTGLSEPGPIAVDARNGRLFVASGDTVNIYKIRDPKKDPKTIPLGFSGGLRDITYGIMNAVAYGIRAENGSIWEINPKKDTVKEILPADFFPAEKGQPARVFSSTDGAYLHVLTETPAQLLRIRLRKTKVEEIRPLDKCETTGGIAMYRDLFLIGDPCHGALQFLQRDTGPVRPAPSPEGIPIQPALLDVDNFNVVLLDRAVGQTVGRLVQYDVREIPQKK